MPFFDHNATTPLHPAAREAWLRAAEEAWHNPSSPYRAAARAHRLLEEARGQVAAVMGLAPERVVFTSGATEANNAVLAWAARALPRDARILVAATEHPSVLAPARLHFGERMATIPVDQGGRIDPAVIARLLEETRPRAGLVAVMAANNETGVLGPSREVAAACRAGGAFCLCDASQWIGRMPADALPRDAFLVGCAHKFGGPKGTGFVGVPAGADGFFGARGGEQEAGRRGGTENLPAVAAMAAVLAVTAGKTAAERTERSGWRDAFVETVRGAIPGARLNGGGDRLWNTVSLCLPAHENTRWVARLDRRGFEVSTGSACATGSPAPSHVLAAMGVAPEEARRTIRVSAGWETTAGEWRELAAALAGAWRELESDAPGGLVVQV